MERSYHRRKEGENFKEEEVANGPNAAERFSKSRAERQNFGQQERSFSLCTSPLPQFSHIMK